jgi:hypothetical protein
MKVSREAGNIELKFFSPNGPPRAGNLSAQACEQSGQVTGPGHRIKVVSPLMA